MQNLKVIFEDNHIIVVEKPVNIPSQANKRFFRRNQFGG